MFRERPLILIADDESKIRRVVAANLERSGFDVCSADDGQRALEIFEHSVPKPDLLVLDVMMPEKEGFEVLEAVRKVSGVPVILLTAKGEVVDKMRGFSLGADDYLTKPFSLEELQARILAVLRRTSGRRDVASERLTNGPLVMMPAKRTCSFGASPVRLTDTEYRLLRLLMEKPGHLRTHEELLRTVWGPEAIDDLPLLRVTITRIRKKLQAAGAEGPVIASYSGVGYLLDDYDDL